MCPLAKPTPFEDIGRATLIHGSHWSCHPAERLLPCLLDVSRNAFDVALDAIVVAKNAFGVTLDAIVVTRNAFEVALDAIVVVRNAFDLTEIAVWTKEMPSDVTSTTLPLPIIPPKVKTMGVATCRSLLQIEERDRVAGSERSGWPRMRSSSANRAIAFFKLGCHGHGALTWPCKAVKADPHSHGHVEAP